jgi:serine/threonine-protein kinase
MRDDTLVTGQVTRAGDGDGQEWVAGWSVPGYTGLEALGSGGFGDVVLARHDESGTLVAIKYLRRDLLADARFAEMFRSEAAVLASMDDPHVVRLYEYVESPSGAAIVMELVEGVSLRQILARQGGTTPEAALVVLQGSLLGLAAAHARGVVHRDYKPDNVLVDGDGTSKLTDFGIAARAGDRSVRGGTLAYAPPEQFGGGSASPAGDVYAATATFFECLTGWPPFHGETAAALMYQHLSQPVPVDAVPEPVRPLVAAGMAKHPGDRPADATTFVAALSQVAAAAYGPDWHERGRSHLGEAALLLAALWPSGGPAAAQGTTVQQVPLRQRHRRSWLRRSGAAKVAIAAVVVAAIAGTFLGVRFSGSGSSRPLALPTVTGVSPVSGTTVGGNTVTITGTGLTRAAAVRFGGVRGTIISDADTRITVTSPPRTVTAAVTVTTAAITGDPGRQITGTGAGTVDITVTTPFGTSKTTAADRFTYTAPRPAVTGISPGGGGTAGGTTVTITGTGLAGATGVRFGSADATIVADSSTQITATSPPGTGTVPITVTTAAGTSSNVPVGRFTYTTRPEPAQSISFAAPASGIAGGSAVLSATGGGSGNPVVFSVDPSSGPGVCTVSGTTVIYTGAGSCVIDANQAGNSRYASAPQVQRMIKVNPIPQSISFTAPARGKQHHSAHLSATGGGPGNPVVFSVDSPGVCTVSGNKVTYTAAGNCVIDANQAGNARYADAPQVRRTITVSKLSQSIIFFAPSAGTIFNSASLSAIGGGSGNAVVFSVDPSSGPGVCTVSGTTVIYTGAGSCVIDANQAGNGDYTAAPQVQRTIAVTRTPQGGPGGEVG